MLFLNLSFTDVFMQHSSSYLNHKYHEKMLASVYLFVYWYPERMSLEGCTSFRCLRGHAFHVSSFFLQQFYSADAVLGKHLAGSPVSNRELKLIALQNIWKPCGVKHILYIVRNNPLLKITAHFLSVIQYLLTVLGRSSHIVAL